MRRPTAPFLAAAGILLGLVILILVQSPPRPPAPSKSPDLGMSLLDWLSAPSRGAKAVHPFEDNREIWHIRIDLPLDRYLALADRLDAEIRARGGILEGRQEERRGGERVFLWRIKAGGEGRGGAVLLFLCPSEPAEGSRPAASRPRAAVIIDDAGFNLELVRELAAIGRPLTIAILPDAPLAAETAGWAAGAGLEVMLHLPLEPSAPASGAPVDTIRGGMDEAAIRSTMERFCLRVPGARGANNHTGSRATEDAAVMLSVLAVLKERGLYFIDSRTSRRSVALAAARAMAVPAAERSVFLDQPPGRATVEARLKDLFAAARKRGAAVGIGHAKRETVEALRDFLGRADAEGVDLVFASGVVR